MRKLSHPELLKRQAEQAQISERFPFAVLVNNVRSLYNVGSVFRTADGLGLEKVWLCGITGIPPSSKITKTALGAEKAVPWEYRDNAVSLIQELKRAGYKIVLLEQTEASEPYQEFLPQAPVCLVVGNEISGVQDGLLPYCDAAVEIEMAGQKNSLNVSVAFGIVAYHFRNSLKAAAGAL